MKYILKNIYKLSIYVCLYLYDYTKRCLGREVFEFCKWCDGLCYLYLSDKFMFELSELI
jgi:hypothetical protein